MVDPLVARCDLLRHNLYHVANRCGTGLTRNADRICRGKKTTSTVSCSFWGIVAKRIEKDPHSA